MVKINRPRLDTNLIFIILLLLISVFLHKIWFFPNSVLPNGDFTYRSLNTLKDFYYNYNGILTFTNLGSFNIQPHFIVTRYIWGVLAVFFNIPWEISVKLTHLVPVAIISNLGMYFFIKYIYKSNYIGFLIALLYSSTTYFLGRETEHLAIAFIYAYTPYLLYIFQKMLDTNKLKHWMLFVLLYSIGLSYEIRIMYIVSGILVANIFFINYHKIFSNKNKKVLSHIFLLGVLLLFVNVYFMYAFMSKGAFSSVVDRTTWGDNIQTLPYAFNVFEHGWNGYTFVKFVPQFVPSILWGAPILAFSSMYLFFTKKKKGIEREQKYYYLGIFLFLLGVFLTKQADIPFRDSYETIRYAIPGMLLFRSASKFYLVSGIGLSLLLGYLLKYLDLRLQYLGNSTERYFLTLAKLLSISIIVVYVIVVNRALYMDTLKLTFANHVAPTDLIMWNQQLASDSEFYRILYVPFVSEWIDQTDRHPAIDYKQFKGDLAKMNMQGYDLPVACRFKVLNIYCRNDVEILLEKLNVKYVFFSNQPPITNSNLLEEYDNNKPLANDEGILQNLSNYKLYYSDDHISIFERYPYKPRIYLSSGVTDDSNITFDNYDEFPSTYLITLGNKDDNGVIYYSGAYDPNWVLSDIPPSPKSFFDRHRIIKSTRTMYGLNSFNISELKSSTGKLYLYYEPNIILFLLFYISIFSFVFITIFFLVLCKLDR